MEQIFGLVLITVVILIILSGPISLLFMGMEKLVRYVTEGDYKKTFHHRGYCEKDEWYFMGKRFLECDLVAFWFSGLCGGGLMVLYCAAISDMIKAGSDVTYLSNPVISILGGLVTLALLVGGSAFIAKQMYRVSKKVKILKKDLENHMNDKDAHK